MKDKGGWQKYQGLMADWAAGFITAKGVGADASAYSEDELNLFGDIFRRFSEISEAVDNIDLCFAFISARTPRRKGLKLDAYLTYHITFYLQEIYILNERLDAYAKIVMRRKRRAGGIIDKSMYERLGRAVRAALSNIVKLRGAHVHDRAFSDEQMKLLSTYSFLAVQKQDDPVWGKLAKSEYAERRSHWVGQLKKNREGIQLLLDTYFEFIHGEVESIIAAVPNNSSKPTPLRGAA